MKMTKNIWKPDTCGCVLEFEFDSDLPSEERVHTPTACLKACGHHPMGADVAAHHAGVLAENQKKNRAMTEVLGQVSEGAKEAVAWAFDQSRNVVITLPESEKDKGITTKEEGVIIQ